MENATKALMIAAAVLVVMLIIGLGIGIFNTASEQVDNAGDLSEYQVQQFNDKFRKYEGLNVTGAEVNAMITTVFNHNNEQADETTMVQIVDNTQNNADLDPENYDNTRTPTKVSTGSKYSVTALYTNNLINMLIIDEPGVTNPTSPNNPG